MKNDEYEALIKETEVLLSRLHALYEQWFQGIERHEPRLMKREATRRLEILRRSQPRNTALRFRAQQVLQRYTTLNHHWTKIGRQIEEGTYKRDVMRANRLLKKAPPRPSDTLAEGDGVGVVELERTNEPRPEAADVGGYDLDFGSDEELEAMLAGLESPAPKPVPAKPAVATPPAVAAPPAATATPKPVSGPAAPAAGAKPAPPPPPPSGHLRPPGAAPPVPGAVRPPPPPPPPSGLLRPMPGAPPSAVGKPAPQAPAVAAPKPVVPPVVAVPKPVAPPPVAARVEPPKPPPREAGLDDERMRAIYDRYVDARRRNNERVDNVKFETVASSIEKMIPGLAEKHRGKNIDFEVVVKDGRVGLKPVAK